MNYGELKVYLANYVNRTDLTDDLFDVWQSSVNQRVARDIKTRFLMYSVTLDNPYGDVIYPFDDSFAYAMNELVSVSLVSSASGGPQPLVAVSFEMLEEARAIGLANGVTEPYCYAMFSTGFMVAPGDQSEHSFNVVFRGFDRTMGSDIGSNQMATFFQGPYLDAFLIEIYKYLRDVEGEQLATARYEMEVKKFNDYELWQQSGANPDSNKGAWSWH
jgi:hypothetical protein